MPRLRGKKTRKSTTAARISQIKSSLLTVSIVAVLMVLSMLPSTGAYIVTSSDKWSGYEFWGYQSSDNVWEAYAQFTVPTVYPADNGGCPLWGGHCTVAIWVGLGNGYGGSMGLAQAGITGDISCPLWWCNGPTYWAWREYFYPPPQTSITFNCQNFPVSPGNVMFVDVYSSGEFGGDPQTYTLSVTNLSTGQNCQIYSGTTLGTPHYAEFQVEKLHRLAHFDAGGNQVWFHQAYLYYRGSIQSITSPYNDGSWASRYMYNNPYQNTDIGSLQSDPSGGGQFYVHWRTSYGT